MTVLSALFGIAVVLLAVSTAHEWISSPAQAQQSSGGGERISALENRIMQQAGLCHFPGSNLDENQRNLNAAVQVFQFDYAAMPDHYITIVDGQSYSVTDLAAMSEEQRRVLANAWVFQEIARVGMDPSAVFCPEMRTDELTGEIDQLDGDIDQLDEDVSALEDEVITFTATLESGNSDLPPVYTGPTNSWDHNIQPGYGFQMQCQISEPGATLHQLYTLTCMRVEQ
jgi:hypothetical protein